MLWLFELAHVQITYVNGLKFHVQKNPSWQEYSTSPSQFPTFYGTRSFITMFRRARTCPISWARSLRYTSSYPISSRSPLILFYHQHLGLPSGVSFRFFNNQNPVCTPPLPHTWHTPYYLFSFDAISQEISGKKHNHEAPHYTVYHNSTKFHTHTRLKAKL